MTPIEALPDRAKTNSNDTAFIASDDKWTYGRLAVQAERLACGLAARGIRKGDRIVLHMPNRGPIRESAPLPRERLIEKGEMRHDQ
jgi:non-ribosomal peptide synthetase component E (peptide arylation enzyme)